MRIGIFGGSFNPPHKMHEEMCLYLVDNNYLDKIIFVPTGSKYKYKNNLISDLDRFNMVKLITDKYNFLDVSNYELKSEVVYTIDTLEYFKSIYPKDEIYFICGTDNLTYMDKWMRGLDILKNYKILVIKRSTDDIDEILSRFHEYKNNIIVADMDQKDLSSTMIRENIEDNKLYLDEDVMKYIENNNLYK